MEVSTTPQCQYPYDKTALLEQISGGPPIPFSCVSDAIWSTPSISVRLSHSFSTQIYSMILPAPSLYVSLITDH